MKMRVKGTAALSVIMILFLASGYVGLSIYYRDNFAVNTWINGVYCTGKTAREVNAELLERTESAETFTIIGYDRVGPDAVETSWTISMEDLRHALSYEDGLNDCLASQNSWFWMNNLFVRRERFLQAAVSYDEQVLESLWERITDALYAEEDYRIAYGDDSGYTLYDGLHNRLDEEKAWRMIQNALSEGASRADLIAGECYYDASPDKEQEERARLWEKIEQFQGNGPVYDFGDGAERLGRARMSAFLEKDETSGMPLFDEDGHFVLARGGAENWIEEMALVHDTYGKEWDFQSTRGDVVQVKGVTYGTTIDQKREIIWLSEYLEGLAEGEVRPDEGARIPEYQRDAFHRGCGGIGDTYVEVDLGIQKLYYYENGELRLETDVVSGNKRRRMSTPEGVNFVYSKQKNRVLRGEGYAAPVKFWMPVKGSIGIHDSDWRDEFGGDVYKTDGSHGCVNLPPDAMAELYDMVEIGTPVVMFYGEEPDGAGGNG